MLFLAIERLHITGPVFAVVTLHGLAFVVRVDDCELVEVSRLASITTEWREIYLAVSVRVRRTRHYYYGLMAGRRSCPAGKAITSATNDENCVV